MAPALLPLRLDRFALPIFHLLENLKLGVIKERCDKQNSLRAKALWESADKLGIKLYEFRLFGKPLDTFLAVYKNQTKFFYELPRPNAPLSKGFWWMDNKPIMRKKFANQGIPVAIGGSCFRFSSALEIFRQIKGKTIIKPSIGSRSRHTTINITTEEELQTAFRKAKKLSPFVLVEQQLEGDVYRASVVGGKFAASMSRQLPNVTGDGVHTVRQLVEIENQNPKRREGIFHEIPLAGLKNLDSIPTFGEIIYLADKVSRGVGAITVDVTDQTHPDNIVLFEKIATVLDVAVVGIDFIIANISKSWRDQKLCGVIECNSAPFLDLHHYPYTGTPRDVSGQLWRLTFEIPE